MTTDTRATEILAIPGSVGVGTFDVSLIHNAAREAPEDAELVLYSDPSLWAMPPYAPGVEANEGVEHLRRAVGDADGLLLATPEYNGSMPAVIKNAIDWAAADLDDGPRPLVEKPVAVVGADAGNLGCDWAIADARKVLEVAGARVLRDGLAIRRAADAFRDGVLVDAGERSRLSALMELLTLEARAAAGAETGQGS